MPLGNSTTEGYTDGSLTASQMIGYRYGLRYLLKNAGYKIDFVGSQSNGDLYFNDCQHAGIGGTRDQYLVRLLTDGYDERNGVQILNPPRPYLDEYSPDIILLHIGTNDITHEDSDALTNEKISDILDLIDEYEVRAGKEVTVFLALIINRVKPWLPGSKALVTTDFNTGIKAMAQARIAGGDKIVIVDMENDAGFEYTYETDMANDGQGIHPNSFGYSKMANLWYTSIAANYNSSPVIEHIPEQVFNEGEASPAILLDAYVEDLQDPDQDILWTYQQLGSVHLNITLNASRQVVAEPLDDEWSGKDTVVFTATDQGINGNDIKSARDTVVFRVVAVNDAPVINSTPSLQSTVGELYTYTFSASDIDDPSLFLSAVMKPDWLSFSETTGLLSGIPGPGDQGDNEIILRASDGLLNTDQDFHIDVGIASSMEGLHGMEVNLYPVPARDYILMDFADHAGEIQLEIISATGMIMDQKVVPADMNHLQLDTSNLSEGIYLLHITGVTGDYFRKFSIIR